MKLFGNGNATGFAILETDGNEEALINPKALLGLCWDNSTGSVWLMIFWIEITLKRG